MYTIFLLMCGDNGPPRTEVPMLPSTSNAESYAELCSDDLDVITRGYRWTKLKERWVEVHS